MHYFNPCVLLIIALFAACSDQKSTTQAPKSGTLGLANTPGIDTTYAIWNRDTDFNTEQDTKDLLSSVYIGDTFNPHTFKTCNVYVHPDTNSAVIKILPPITPLKIISFGEPSLGDTVEDGQKETNAALIDSLSEYREIESPIPEPWYKVITIDGKVGSFVEAAKLSIL